MPDWLTGELWNDLIAGALVTIGLTIVSSILALALGRWAALARLGSRPGRRRIARLYVEVFRNVPALILVIFFAFAVPNLVPVDLRKTLFFDNVLTDALSTVTGLILPWYAFAAMLALALNTGGHLAEILRSGIAAVPTSRLDASRSLGLDHDASLRNVVLPAAVRVAFPAISNRLVHNMKNTSLASFVAVPELFNAFQGAITRTFQASELLVLAALFYLVLSTAMTAGLDLVGRRLGATATHGVGHG